MPALVFPQRSLCVHRITAAASAVPKGRSRERVLRVVGQGASYPETFAMIADMLEHFGMTEVSQLPNEQITVFAGALGLVEPPPGLGNFDQGWRAVWGIPPDE